MIRAFILGIVLWSTVLSTPEILQRVPMTNPYGVVSDQNPGDGLSLKKGPGIDPFGVASDQTPSDEPSLEVGPGIDPFS